MNDTERISVIKQHIKYRESDFYDDIRWLIKKVEQQEEELDHYRSMAALKVAGVCTNTNAKNVK